MTEPQTTAGITEDREFVKAVAETAFDIAHEHCGEDGCTAGGLPFWQDATGIVLLALTEHAKVTRSSKPTTQEAEA